MKKYPDLLQGLFRSEWPTKSIKFIIKNGNQHRKNTATAAISIFMVFHFVRNNWSCWAGVIVPTRLFITNHHQFKTLMDMAQIFVSQTPKHLRIFFKLIMITTLLITFPWNTAIWKRYDYQRDPKMQQVCQNQSNPLFHRWYRTGTKCYHNLTFYISFFRCKIPMIR